MYYSLLVTFISFGYDQDSICSYQHEQDSFRHTCRTELDTVLPSSARETGAAVAAAAAAAVAAETAHGRWSRE